MDMERAKNIIIALLVIINAALGAMIYNERRSYALPQSHVAAIRDLLYKNNIALYDTPITDASPKRRPELEPVDIDERVIISLFFGGADEADISVYEDGGRLFYEWGDETVEKDGNTVYYYTAEDESTDTVPSAEETYALCDAFTEKLNGLTGLSLKRDKRVNAAHEHERVVEYRPVYKKLVVYSCSARFTVTAAGITNVRLTLFNVAGFTGDEREVYGCDEALFQLMYRLKSDYGDGGDSIKVMDMDMVYAADAPYYRFYVRPGGNEGIRLEPYLVNAYTNKIMN